MPKSSHSDVAQTIQQELAAGSSAGKIHQRLQEGGAKLARSSVYRYQQRWRQTGTTENLEMQKKGRKCLLLPEHVKVRRVPTSAERLLADLVQALLNYLKHTNPAAELSELAGFLSSTFAVTVSLATIRRCLQRSCPAWHELPRPSVHRMARQASSMAAPPPPALGLRHITLPVAKLDASSRWYVKVLRFARKPTLDRRRRWPARLGRRAAGAAPGPAAGGAPARLRRADAGRTGEGGG